MRTQTHRLRRAALRVAIGVVVLCAPCIAPFSASAACMDTDEIAGVPLNVSGLHREAPDVDAASGMLLGPDGRALWARDTSAQRAIASITKIMTALVVFDHAELDDLVTVSQAASEVPYAAGLEPGERRTVRELLELALVASSNDAAHALAEHVGTTVDGFVSMMNARASREGLSGTHFANPHGLDAKNHYSCATDVATLSRIAMELPEYRRIIAMDSITLPPFGERAVALTVENTDRLLAQFDGLVGGKTGFTDDADYCFTGVAQRGEIALTAIVLGARTSEARFAEASRLLDWGFDNLTVQTIATTTGTVARVPLTQNPARRIGLRFAETTSAAVFSFDGPVTRTVDTASSVDLPVFEGQPLGQVTLAQGERVLATLAAVAAQDMASAEETVGFVPVSDYLDRTVVAKAAGTALDVPEFDPDRKLERRVLLDPHVRAPVSPGDQVGIIAYTQDGNVVLEVPIVAAEKVAAPKILERAGIWLARAWRWVFGRPTMARPQLVVG